MNTIPDDIIITIFEYIPSLTYKFLFKNISNLNYKLLDKYFSLSIKDLKKKNKEWLLVEIIIKQDKLALYYIVEDLNKITIINLLIYLVKYNKLDFLEIILEHPFAIKYCRNLDLENINNPLYKLIRNSSSRFIEN